MDPIYVSHFSEQYRLRSGHMIYRLRSDFSVFTWLSYQHVGIFSSVCFLQIVLHIHHGSICYRILLIRLRTRSFSRVISLRQDNYTARSHLIVSFLTVHQLYQSMITDLSKQDPDTGMVAYIFWRNTSSSKLAQNFRVTACALPILRDWI